MTDPSEYPSLILQLLTRAPEGMIMKDIAGALSLNRNAVAKYLGILYQQGQVDVRYIGKAKVFTVSKRVPFSLLLELSADAILGVNRNMACVHANARFCDWAGQTPEQVLGKPVGGILSHPVMEQVQIMDMIRAGISTGAGPERVSVTYQNRDFFYKIRCIPVVFVDGTTGCAVVISDITEKETSAARISLLEQQCSSLSNAQHEYIVHSLPDGTITHANPAFASLAGVAPEQLTGKKYCLDMDPDDCALVQAHFRAITKDDPEKNIDHRIRTHSGEERWVHWTNRGIFRNGILIEFFSYGTDITELVAAREQLRTCQEKTESVLREKIDELRIINNDLLAEIEKRKFMERTLFKTQFCLNNSTEMILCIDETGTVIFSNKSATTVLGATHRAPCLFPSGSSRSRPPLSWPEIWKSAQQMGAVLFEAGIITRNNTLLDVEILVNYLYYDDCECCCLFVRDITERKKAEEALQESRELFATTFYNGPLMLTISDIETGRYIDTNYQFTLVSGYSREEAIGKTSVELGWISKEDRDSLYDDLNRSGRIVEKEFRLKKKDGSRVWCVFFCEIINAAGKAQLLTLAQDITARKRAEVALGQSERRLACSQSIAHIGSWELDHGTKSLSFSDEVYRIFGFAPQEAGLGYEAFLALVHPDDRGAVEEAYRGSIREKRAGCEIEYRVVRRSTGEIRFIHEKCRHIMDNHGAIITSVGMVHDITERKRAEQDLMDSVDHYSDIISHVPLGFFRSTVEGKVLFINTAFASMLGYESPWDLIDEINRSSVARVLYEAPERRAELVAKVLESKSWVFFENRYKRKDGSILSANLMFRSFKNPRNGRIEVEGFVEDLTGKNALERYYRVSGSQQKIPRLDQHISIIER